MFCNDPSGWLVVGPTPHGVGGLKFGAIGVGVLGLVSHPTRGGWIEISTYDTAQMSRLVPPHTGWVD